MLKELEKQQGGCDDSLKSGPKEAASSCIRTAGETWLLPPSTSERPLIGRAYQPHRQRGLGNVVSKLLAPWAAPCHTEETVEKQERYLVPMVSTWRRGGRERRQYDYHCCMVDVVVSPFKVEAV